MTTRKSISSKFSRFPVKQNNSFLRIKPHIKNSVINQSICDNLPNFVESIINYLAEKIRKLSELKHQLVSLGVPLYTTDFPVVKNNYLAFSKLDISLYHTCVASLTKLKACLPKLIMARILDEIDYSLLPLNNEETLYNYKIKADRSIKEIYKEPRFNAQLTSYVVTRHVASVESVLQPVRNFVPSSYPYEWQAEARSYGQNR